ncbi:hypothetical protein RED65_05329 [Oceanobacter sp. RED65]|uniref:Tetratricopeptide repeat protein n=1 Tax=Bermanella marisrubri TaxID=207949 RepID=Q1N0Q1_9GAMM|nr:hypothetical protein RED65_05329 [Oceanobacter sp. RED65] [Bermanella marisrubri]
MEEDLTDKTIANIRPIGFRLAKMNPPETDTKEAIRRYQQFLQLAPNNDTRVHVMHRLADLKLMDLEEILSEDVEKVDQKQVEAVYDEAITTYERVLKLFPNRLDSDMLLYQLAKVYSLKGDSVSSLNALQRLVARFEKSELLMESYYRMGDIYFTLGQYDNAERSFAKVTQQSSDNRFYLSAQYMMGWSEFKQSKFDEALISFIAVIDERFEDTAAIVTASRSDKDLLEDTTRVMSMIFSAGRGHRQIANLFQRIGKRHYEYLIYDSLAEYYLSKQQYTDAARTFTAFVQTSPNDVLAPAFYSNVVKTYKQAGYIDQVLEHKMAYVERYGTRSKFWNLYGEDIREMIRPNIKTYASELAQYHHAKGQKSKSLKIKFNHLLAASRWYDEYILTFPNDSNVGEMHFLKGEALFEVGRYDQAVSSYLAGAFDSPRHDKAEESGFAALVTYNQLIAKSKGESYNQWVQQKVDTAIRYSQSFPNSSNVAQVLARAAEGLFSLNQFDKATSVAQQVLSNPKASPSQISVALLIKGHSHFDLKQYVEAEQAYSKVLSGKHLEKNKVKDVQEKLAASIYKQAVALVEAKQIDNAVDTFMRVGERVPSSPIRITAHYDAASYLMKAQKWDRAQELLLSFREQFPKHKLAKDIPSKLIIAYENTQEWDKAAYELETIWRTSRVRNEQRIALYQAAEYFEKANDMENAMTMLKRYAHNYPKPFNAQLEAISRLENIYNKQEQHEKRQYWLDKLIIADKKAGKERTDRSRFLAAKASFDLADYKRRDYAKIPLTLPLRTSLAKKKVALKSTLDAYKRTAKMEVQEFTTAATFQIAEIYGELSRDLMNSERPAGLDELELEEYEFLLEDQAFPFEEAAINIHESNIKRSWDGLYDNWIAKSVDALGTLMPARYAKKEINYDVIAEIH